MTDGRVLALGITLPPATIALIVWLAPDSDRPAAFIAVCAGVSLAAYCMYDAVPSMRVLARRRRRAHDRIPIAAAGLSIVLAFAGCRNESTTTTALAHTPAASAAEPTAPVTQTPSPSPTKAVADAGKATDHGLVEIADLKLVMGKDVVMHVLVDGTIEAPDGGGGMSESGSITADGRVTGPGWEGTRLLADGSVTNNGNPLELRLDGDTLTVWYKIPGDDRPARRRRWTIDAKGNVLEDGRPFVSLGDAVRVEGASTLGTRRAALLLFGLQFDVKLRGP